MATTNPVLQAERLVLSNGLVLLHSPAAANPSVVVRLLIGAGASRETPEQQGLAGLTGRMLRQGTQSIDKERLAEELDGMGAGLSIDVGYALTVASVKCLSSDFDRSLAILAEVVRRPTFPDVELERVRGQLLTDIREMEDNTRVIAERAWRSAAYPVDHRYARLTIGTEESVRSFSQADVAAFHRQWFGANQAILLVVGDVSLDAARARAEQELGDWNGVPAAPVAETLPGVPDPAPASLRENMVGKTQADVVLGLPALARTDPDYYALAFANHILGRMYFMGRFGEEVRDKQGLAYYAYSELQGGLGNGPWVVRAGVNPTNLDRALAAIRGELDRFLADGPTPEEQADGIASLLGSLPRQLETNEGTAAVLGEIELYDLGLDYLDRYPDIIRGLTRESVLAAAQRWIKRDHLVAAVAGPAVD